MVPLTIIAAVAANGVIGREGSLPWHLPDDFKHFKALTTGHPVIMGRKTYESIGRPLPKRRNIVVTSRATVGEGAEVASSLPDALAKVGPGTETFVIGGAQLYREALNMAQRLVLTRVDAEVEGDIVFPEVDWSRWRLVQEQKHEADARHAYSFRMCTYERQYE